MKGTTITVLRNVTTGIDDFGQPLTTEHAENVTHVLVAPVSDKDLSGSTRPQGIEVDLVVHFPRSYTDSLRNTRIKIGEHIYKVVGDPIAYMPDNTPGQWNRPVHVQRING